MILFDDEKSVQHHSAKKRSIHSFDAACNLKWDKLNLLASSMSIFVLQELCMIQLNNVKNSPQKIKILSKYQKLLKLSNDEDFQTLSLLLKFRRKRWLL